MVYLLGIAGATGCLAHAWKGTASALEPPPDAVCHAVSPTYPATGKALPWKELAVDFWAGLLLRGINRDCSGAELATWNPTEEVSTACLAPPPHGPYREGALFDERRLPHKNPQTGAAAPSTAVALTHLSARELLVHEVSAAEVWVWLMTQRFSNGEMLGPVAQVKRDGRRVWVTALGTLRAMPFGATMRREDVGILEMLVVESAACAACAASPAETQEGCGKALVLLAHNGNRLVALPIFSPAGGGDAPVCGAWPRLRLSHREEERLAHGGKRVFTLSARVAFEEGGAQLLENVTVMEQGARMDKRAARLLRSAEDHRTLSLRHGVLMFDQSDLLERVKRAVAGTPTTATSATPAAKKSYH